MITSIRIVKDPCNMCSTVKCIIFWNLYTSLTSIPKHSGRRWKWRIATEPSEAILLILSVKRITIDHERGMSVYLLLDLHGAQADDHWSKERAWRQPGMSNFSVRPGISDPQTSTFRCWTGDLRSFNVSTFNVNHWGHFNQEVIAAPS